MLERILPEGSSHTAAPLLIMQGRLTGRPRTKWVMSVTQRPVQSRSGRLCGQTGGWRHSYGLEFRRLPPQAFRRYPKTGKYLKNPSVWFLSLSGYFKKGSGLPTIPSICTPASAAIVGQRSSMDTPSSCTPSLTSGPKAMNGGFGPLSG